MFLYFCAPRKEGFLSEIIKMTRLSQIRPSCLYVLQKRVYIFFVLMKGLSFTHIPLHIVCEYSHTPRSTWQNNRYKTPHIRGPDKNCNELIRNGLYLKLRMQCLSFAKYSICRQTILHNYFLNSIYTFSSSPLKKNGNLYIIQIFTIIVMSQGIHI